MMIRKHMIRNAMFLKNPTAAENPGACIRGRAIRKIYMMFRIHMIRNAIFRKKSYRCGKFWCVYMRTGNPDNKYDDPETYDPECNIPEKIRSGKL